MIIKTSTARHYRGHEIRIDVDGKIHAHSDNKRYTLWCWGRRWIKSQQRFSKMVMVFDFDSYEIEVSA